MQRLIKLIQSVFQTTIAPRPIPGLDAHWIGYCHACKSSEMQCSRGGFYNGGIKHCYHCGAESEIQGFRSEDLESMRTSSWAHWQNYPRIPFNWHELPEQTRWEILEGRSA